jgi:hypothetical protein
MVRLTEGEKKLLNTLGNYPDMPTKELIKHANYQWIGTVRRKLDNSQSSTFYADPFMRSITASSAKILSTSS